MPDDVIVGKAAIIERCIASAREELNASAVVDQNLADRLMRMVGFRNLAVHQRHKLDLGVVRAVIEKNLDDLLEFSAIALRLSFSN